MLGGKREGVLKKKQEVSSLGCLASMERFCHLYSQGILGGISDR